ncbi:Uncharacterised protein [Legionella lansingensis]|uniref:Uncharacterized protein n=1 Tax=Legionella lansingensis TaxID=45067 RepID=A0A0W0VRW2_9GAMM|nr:hypothetical protein [Legionella lansingensis]KTD22773.1 hypothetical protein Llan_1124 [Legionella lansingensis]SNV57106.1 Uncharacterised protein [Legionella lansingensis]
MVKIRRNKLRALLFFIFLPLIVYADDVANGPEEFNMRECIKESIADCIEAACIQGAPTNCQEQCQIDAMNKCKEIAKQTL